MPAAAPRMSEVAAALSGLSLEERNPGLTSGEDTPRTSQSVDGEASAVDEVDDVDEDLYGDELLDDDILHEDPIIHIAHAQAAAGTTAAFRARPAPPSTFMEGMGPRLTKAAALRQGLEWEDPRDERRALGEEVPVDFEEVPGHKRALNLNVASLAEPSVAPRLNRAALLRLGVPVDEPVRNVAETAARNKARDKAERDLRRRSVALPPTLAAPEMAPRQNRAALLRLGQVPASQGRNPRDVAEQAVLNKEREAAERLAKRKSVALPASLAAPSIAPRQNRASMLRTGPPMFSDSTARPAPSPAPPAAAQPVRENRASQLRAGTGKPPAAPSARHAASASMSFAAPRAAPPPPAGRHRAAASVSSTRSTASSAAATASSTTASASTEAKADRRTSIFGRLGRTSTTPRTVPEPRPTRSSLLREGLGAKIGKARA